MEPRRVRVNHGALVRSLVGGLVGGAVAWGWGSFLGALLHRPWLGLVVGFGAAACMAIALAFADAAAIRVD